MVKSIFSILLRLASTNYKRDVKRAIRGSTFDRLRQSKVHFRQGSCLSVSPSVTFGDTSPTLGRSPLKPPFFQKLKNSTVLHFSENRKNEIFVENEQSRESQFFINSHIKIQRHFLQYRCYSFILFPVKLFAP